MRTAAKQKSLKIKQELLSLLYRFLMPCGLSHHLVGVLVSCYLMSYSPKPKDVGRVTVAPMAIAAPNTPCSLPGAQKLGQQLLPPTCLSFLPLGIAYSTSGCPRYLYEVEASPSRSLPVPYQIAQCQCQFVMGTAPCHETLEDAHTRSCLSCLVILPLQVQKVTAVTVGAGRHTQR